MGEVRIKSGNLFDLENYIANAAYVHNIEITSISNGISIISTSSDDPYINPSYNVVGQQITLPSVKRAMINCKSNTAYTLYFQQSQNVAKRISYFNSEFIVVKGFDAFDGSIFNIITPDDCVYILIRIGNSATLPKGTQVELTNIQLLEGTYTSETIPEYQPYFLNRPAHQFINGEWIDIPTHKFINNRWQGELTSQSPLRFRADGEMLDWRVEGKTSGNLVESVKVSTDQTLYGISLFLEADLKPDTIYTFAFQLTEGYFVYWNEFLFTNETPLVTGAGDTMLVVTKRTRSDISKDNANQYRSSKGWVIHKNMKTQSSPASYNNVQILEGTYTASTLPPYEPYGGVGDWDETEQKYRIPVRVEGENLYTIELGDDRWGTLANSQIISRTDGVLQIEMTSERNSGVYALSASAIMQLSDIRSTVSYSFDIRADTDISVLVGYEVQGARAILQVSDEWVTVKFENILFTQSYSFTIVNRSSGGTVYVRNFMFKEGTTTNLYTDHQLMDGDSIDYTTTETTIPLATGNNTLTVDTAVQPKSIFVKFEG